MVECPGDGKLLSCVPVWLFWEGGGLCSIVHVLCMYDYG